MGSLAGGWGWGSSNAEESPVDPEEESVEESLDDSSLEGSSGSLFLFWGGGFGALLGSRLGGRWGLGLGFGAVGGLGGGSGVGVARAVHTRAGGGGWGGLCGHLLAVRRRWGQVANAVPPSMRVARTLPRAAT